MADKDESNLPEVVIEALAAKAGESSAVAGAATAGVAAHNAVVAAQIAAGLAGDGIIGVATAHLAAVPWWASAVMAVPYAPIVVPAVGVVAGATAGYYTVKGLRRLFR